jgi:ABC-2 type transporter
MNTAVGRLVRAELRLMTRDPLVLTFVFAFPIVTMLIIGGAFGTHPDQAFDYTNPSHWYVASYLTVVIAATGLVMLPVHLASYRERGVLRRFAAAGFPRWSFAIAQLVRLAGAGNPGPFGINRWLRTGGAAQGPAQGGEHAQRQQPPGVNPARVDQQCGQRQGGHHDDRDPPVVADHEVVPEGADRLEPPHELVTS